MDKTMSRSLGAGAALAGAALLGAAIYYWREKQTEEPDYRALLTEDATPGPPERAKLHSSSSSGMAMASVMVSMGAPQ